MESSIPNYKLSSPAESQLLFLESLSRRCSIPIIHPSWLFSFTFYFYFGFWLRSVCLFVLARQVGGCITDTREVWAVATPARTSSMPPSLWRFT
jgi:hypothetical protein